MRVQVLIRQSVQSVGVGDKPPILVLCTRLKWTLDCHATIGAVLKFYGRLGGPDDPSSLCARSNFSNQVLPFFFLFLVLFCFWPSTWHMGAVLGVLETLFPCDTFRTESGKPRRESSTIGKWWDMCAVKRLDHRGYASGEASATKREKGGRASCSTSRCLEL